MFTELDVTLVKGTDIPESIGTVNACAQFSTSFASELALMFSAFESNGLASGSGAGKEFVVFISKFL